MMSAKKVAELVKGGSDIEVTNDNFPEYVEACLKYKWMDMIKPQLNELLLGFFDIVSEPLLTMFDYHELEFLMCGLPKIDTEDWKKHTEYSGDYEELGEYHPTCQWLWEVVAEFDRQKRMLQHAADLSRSHITQHNLLINATCGRSESGIKHFLMFGCRDENPSWTMNNNTKTMFSRT